jgi:hypothetical protein
MSPDRAADRMIPEANQIALQAAELFFILGTRFPFLPDVVGEARSARGCRAGIGVDAVEPAERVRGQELVLVDGMPVERSA